MNRLSARVWLGAGIALVSFFICLHLVTITDGVTAVVSDGRAWFGSESGVHRHAMFGMGISAVSFVAIIAGALWGKGDEKKYTTYTVCFAVVSFLAVLTVVSAYWQYSGDVF